MERACCCVQCSKGFLGEHSSAGVASGHVACVAKAAARGSRRGLATWQVGLRTSDRFSSVLDSSLLYVTLPLMSRVCDRRGHRRQGLLVKAECRFRDSGLNAGQSATPLRLQAKGMVHLSTARCQPLAQPGTRAVRPEAGRAGVQLQAWWRQPHRLLAKLDANVSRNAQLVELRLGLSSHLLDHRGCSER